MSDKPIWEQLAEMGRAAMPDDLPEPEQTSYVTDSVMRSIELHTFTADQMHAYAAAQVAKERERCAKVCDEHAKEAWDHEAGAWWCADAIRKGE